MAGRRVVLLAVLAWSSTGCAFALPPSRVELGGGVRRWSGAERGEPAGPVAALRASMHPLQLDPASLQRPVDFGVGYLLDAYDFQEPGTTVHGAFVELSGSLPISADGPNVVVLSARQQGRMLFDAVSPLPGAGFAVQLSFEAVSFTRGPWSTNRHDELSAGVSYGEVAMGLYLEGATGLIGADHVQTLTGGLMLRVPALLGAGFFLPR
jgi:hypothetical protein